MTVLYDAREWLATKGPLLEIRLLSRPFPTSCKGIRNPGKMWKWRTCDFGIRNTALGIRSPTNDCNLESKTLTPESKTVLDNSLTLDKISHEEFVAQASNRNFPMFSKNPNSN